MNDQVLNNSAYEQELDVNVDIQGSDVQDDNQ